MWRPDKGKYGGEWDGRTMEILLAVGFHSEKKLARLLWHQ
jgi:hypothetical protein